MNYISFPGLGIGEFSIKQTAFTVFGRDVAWYGIILTLGIIAALIYASYRISKTEKLSSDVIYDMAIYVIIAGIIGSRAYYVLTSFDEYLTDNFWDTFVNCISIWNGGLAIYGAIIGGGLALVIYCLIKKINTLQILDVVAPGVMLGQVIGRWGNFVNAEAHGTQTTLPWRMGIRNVFSDNTLYYHPTFLYESLWNLIGFILINTIFYKKKKFHGQIFLIYIGWYGFGRMLIEGLRTDSLYVAGFRISQVIGGVTFIAAVILLAVLGIKAQKAPQADTDSAAMDIEEVSLKEEISETEKIIKTEKECSDDNN